MKSVRGFLSLSWLLSGSLLLHASDRLAEAFPVRGLCIGAPSRAGLDRFIGFIHKGLAPRGVNSLILRVDFNYRYTSHPELSGRAALTKDDVRKLVTACRQHDIRIIPQVNLLGHQSWATRTGALLREYPEFDETPWVSMPEKYAWPNADGLYCKSYCPLHPKVHAVVFAVVDEICDAFEADAFHAGMDEVFYIGEDKCPRCGGKNKAKLFADEVSRIRDHLAKKDRELWIWGDRLLDGKTTGIGEWEASLNHTHPAIDLIPRDVVICDWHYERAHPTAAYFALKGFRVVSCPWKKSEVAIQQVHDMVRLRTHASSEVAARALGMLQTVWSSADGFLDRHDGILAGDAPETNSAASCFIRLFEEMNMPARGGPG